MRISASSCSVRHSDGRSSYGLQHVTVEAGASYGGLVDDLLLCSRSFSLILVDFFWRFSGDLSPILPTSYHNGVAWCLVRGRFFLFALPREMYDYDIAHVLTSPMYLIQYLRAVHNLRPEAPSQNRS
jgi:hypothetical protein